MPDIILYAPSEELDHYMLKRLLRRAGIDESHVRKVTINDPLLHTYPESVIVPLGDKALERLISERESFRWFNRVVMWGDKYVVPNLLPSALLPYKDPDIDTDEDARRHPPRLHGIVMASLRKAVDIAKNGYVLKREEHYLEDPLPLVFTEWVNAYLTAGSPQLSFDIETPYKMKKSSEEDFDEQEYDREILRISFAHNPHHAVSIPFSPEYYDGIRTLLVQPARKIVWNGRTFDIPILNNSGFPVNGEIYDGMDAWHFIQSDLEKGLEFVSGIYTDILPWKHLNNAKPAYYSCVDADAALRNCLGIQAEMEKLGLAGAFKELSIDCMYYLDKAGRRGNYIDIERQSALRELLRQKQTEIYAKVQTLVPANLKPVSIYKKPPEGREYSTRQVVGQVKICSTCKTPITSKSEHHKGKGNPCKNTPTELITGFVPEYVVTEDFNPNSTQQVMAYIRHYNHPMGKNHKTKNDSADTKHLRKLVGKYGKTHPLYAQIIEMHRVSKALSTYVEGLKPDSSGRVYSTYVNAPSTWRLSSRNVNMQNQGKRESNPYAKEARKTIIAPPGHLLVQADSSSIEAVMVGYFMNDPHYMELAKQSIHAYLCCKWLNWEFTPENVKRIKSEHKELYEQLKRVNHGCVTGDHEVLTRNGWVPFKDYNWTDKIAVWDTTGTIHYEVPLARTEHHWEGSMHHLKGRALETVCTPDHAFPVTSVDSRTGKTWTVKRAAEDLPAYGRVPTVGMLSGTVNVDPTVVQLLAAIQADAYIHPEGHVVFGLTKARKQRRLEQLLVGRPYTKSAPDARGQVRYYLSRTTVADVVGLFKAGAYKVFDIARMLEWDRATREYFLDELPHWDGERGTGEGRQRSYMTCVKENAETVQVLAHVTGRQALLREKSPAGRRKRPMWLVSFNDRTAARLESLERNTFEFSGIVYCVTTSTGYFITRYNNRVFALSNTNYGMGPKLMYMNDPEVFRSLKEAKRCQEFLYEQLPGLKNWHHEIRTRAQKEGYLQNPFGIRHYFYDVFSYETTPSGSLRYGPDGLPKIKLGKDAKRAIAFLPQSSAGCFARQNIVRLGQSPAVEWMPANVTVHDGYTLCVPKKDVDTAIGILYTILTRPIPEMGNLTIGCEVEVGENWGEMEKVKL